MAQNPRKLQMTTSRPKVTFLPNGRCVVSGLFWKDFQSLVVEASLWQLKEEKERREETDPEKCLYNQRPENVAWWRRMDWIRRELDQSITEAIRKTWPPLPPKPLKQRLQESVAEHQWVRRFMQAVANIEVYPTPKE